MTKERVDQGIDFTDKEMIQTLKDTVAKNTTDSEFKMFAEMVKATGLNPFKKEIWCIVIPEDKQKDRRREVQIMTGINGFYQIATSDPTYDGLEHGFVAPDGSFQPVTYPKNDYTGAWARVHVKNRRFPQEEVALRAEYQKTYGLWKTKPRHLLLKCGDSIALRKSLPQKLGGIHIPEEIEDLDRAEVENIKPKKLANLKTADEIQKQITVEVMGDDDIPASATQKEQPKEGIHHYELKSYFANMDTDKANKIARKLQKLQGFEVSEDLWCIPSYIENLAQYIVADESTQNNEAA